MNLSAIQNALRERNLDAWLFYDHHHRDAIAYRVLGVPESLMEAAADLGARRWRAVRDVVLPLALPGVVAGSIFTFSLTLGDYITPVLVGGAGSTFIGNVVYSNVGIANNVPFAAALATVPVAIMAVYLLVARRLGAFEAL